MNFCKRIAKLERDLEEVYTVMEESTGYKAANARDSAEYLKLELKMLWAGEALACSRILDK